LFEKCHSFSITFDGWSRELGAYQALSAHMVFSTPKSAHCLELFLGLPSLQVVDGHYKTAALQAASVLVRCVLFSVFFLIFFFFFFFFLFHWYRPDYAN